ncbi:lectin protein type I-like protein [Leptotrombidium deliense]|uniref:Lectin protein type I-like protein n=1 Tax=Leptotrombidium deliense TaxID=299467 RepID=A0A443SJX1_9ACAR|nr:lectin protein type I-like protein [Leptotrombidium deliense]
MRFTLCSMTIVVLSVCETTLGKLYVKTVPSSNKSQPSQPTLKQPNIFSSENLAKFASCDDLCALGWTHIQSKCFMFDATPKEYYESESYCKSLGAKMVTVQSREESEWIGELITANQWTWLGGLTNGTSLSDFYWTDGSSNEFSYFTDTLLQPNKGLVLRKDGKWSYSDFEMKRSIVCQKAPKKCFPETEARIKITQKVVNALDANVTRLVDNFIQNQIRLSADVKRIRSEMNSTGDSIETLLNQANGLQKQIDIIMEYLATLTKTVQRLIAE